MQSSLREAGLGDFVQPISQTVRPVILFLRQLVPDDSLGLASKYGGVPDLPEDFAWPMRPALPNADELARHARELAEQQVTFMRDLEGIPPEAKSPEAVQAFRDQAELQVVTYHRPFPLAFVAQLNLGELSLLAGYPADFPQTGLLSVFTDVSTSAMRLFLHEPTARFARRQFPDELVAYHDSRQSAAHETWKRPNNNAEVLYALPAIMPPAHWGGYPGLYHEKLYNWVNSLDDRYVFSPEYKDIAAIALAGEDANCGSFGDKLGGWPVDIQGHAETDIDGQRISAPGKTPWRQIFSYGGESFGARLIDPDFITDGATYIFLRDEDLAARRFDRARWTLQFT